MKTFGLILLSLDCTQGKCDEEEDDDGNRAKIYVTPLQGGDITSNKYIYLFAQK